MQLQLNTFRDRYRAPIAGCSLPAAMARAIRGFYHHIAHAIFKYLLEHHELPVPKIAAGPDAWGPPRIIPDQFICEAQRRPLL